MFYSRKSVRKGAAVQSSRLRRVARPHLNLGLGLLVPELRGAYLIINHAACSNRVRFQEWSSGCVWTDALWWFRVAHRDQL